MIKLFDKPAKGRPFKFDTAGSYNELVMMPTGAGVTIIDVGTTHKGFINLVQDQVYVSECKRRGVRFLEREQHVDLQHSMGYTR